MIWMKTCMGKDRGSFLDFMRPEMKFSGVDELKMQVLKDKETGRKMHGAER